MWSRGKDVGRCCFAGLGQQKSEAVEALNSNLSCVRGGIARLMTGDVGSAEAGCPLERDSGSSCRPCGINGASARPGDVLTDVVLKLTFDNTAYVQETCDGVEASGLLPDSLSGNSPSVSIRLSGFDELQQSSSSFFLSHLILLKTEYFLVHS